MVTPGGGVGGGGGVDGHDMVAEIGVSIGSAEWSFTGSNKGASSSVERCMKKILTIGLD
jgi:hypothetical protein